MDNYENAIKYIEQQEATDISYVKVGDTARNLVVSFGHIVHGGFASKTSLMTKKYDKDNFDVLYLRDPKKRWYLRDLPKIGENINDTIPFLKNEVTKYEKVIFIGSSMGGYASILFGSLLNVNIVIARQPQTDLNYIQTKQSTFRHRVAGKSSKIWRTYSNLKNIINDTTKYMVSWPAHDDGPAGYHDMHHYENVKDHENILLTPILETCFTKKTFEYIDKL